MRWSSWARWPHWRADAVGDIPRVPGRAPGPATARGHGLPHDYRTPCPGTETGVETRTAPSLIAGRYRVDGLLGEGGMARVFDAFDERLERPVAVKVLRS